MCVHECVCQSVCGLWLEFLERRKDSPETFSRFQAENWMSRFSVDKYLDLHVGLYLRALRTNGGNHRAQVNGAGNKRCRKIFEK